MNINFKSNLFSILKLLKSIRDELKHLTILKKNVLTIEDASFLTGLSVNTLYKYSSQGTLPCSKPNGKKLYFKREELEEWMLANRQSEQPEYDVEIEEALYQNSRK